MILTGGPSNPGGAFVGEVRTPIERTTSRIGQAPPALAKASRADRKTASDARNTTDQDAREHPQSDRDPEGVPRHDPDITGETADTTCGRREAATSQAARSRSAAPRACRHRSVDRPRHRRGATGRIILSRHAQTGPEHDAGQGSDADGDTCCDCRFAGGSDRPNQGGKDVDPRFATAAFRER